ncbi:hypothetical protein H101_00881 [Trichophyton interdigitale H6]|nr:hypothetical protein H101_00881 [Trichophyton interdigitale H6]
MPPPTLQPSSRRRPEEPMLSWPFPENTPVSPQALDQADRLQWLTSRNRGSAGYSDGGGMPSNYGQPGYGSGIASRRHQSIQPYPGIYRQGLSSPENRQRANPQVTTGYLVPYPRRQNDGAGGDSGSANINANNTTANTNAINTIHGGGFNYGSMARPQGSSPSDLTSLAEPVPGFYSPSMPDLNDTNHAFNHRPMGGYQAINDAIGRSDYDHDIMLGQQLAQRQASQESASSSTFSAASPTAPQQAHQDTRPVLPLASEGTRLSTGDIHDLIGSVMDFSSSPDPPQESEMQDQDEDQDHDQNQNQNQNQYHNHNQNQSQDSETFSYSMNPPSAMTTSPAQRRRSAQDMASSENESASHQGQVGSDGMTPRRVRMRTLRVSPASSTQQPSPGTTQLQLNAAASAAASAATSSPERLEEPAFTGYRPRYSTEDILNPQHLSSYLAAMNRGLARTMSTDQRLQILRQYQRRGQLGHGSANTARPPAPMIGLDVEIDGRPEPKDSASLTVNMECKVCMTQLVDTALIPCGHAVLCRWCAQQHIIPKPGQIGRPPPPPTCPVCRTPIKQRVSHISVPSLALRTM